MGTIAVLLSAPDQRILSRLKDVDDLVHLAVPSHEWDWALKLQKSGFAPAPMDIDRLRQPFGYHEIDFEISAAYTNGMMQKLFEQLPDSLSRIVKLHETSFSAWLAFTLSQRIRQMLALEKLHQTYPDETFLLLGDANDLDDYINGLKRLGVSVENDMPEPEPAATPSPAGDGWHQSLIEAVNRRATQLQPLRLRRGTIAFTANMRNRRDFRYHETSLALLKRLSARHKIDFCQPAARFSFPAFRAFAKIKWISNGKINLVPTNTLPSLTKAQKAEWAVPLLQEISKDFDPNGQYLPAAKKELLRWLSDDLPGWIAFAAHLQQAFATSRPKAVVAIPGSSGLGLFFCNAARVNGIPAIDIQTLLHPVSARLAEPAASHIMMLDDIQAKEYTTRFPHRQLEIKTFGPPFVPRLAAQVAQLQNSSTKRTAPFQLLLPTQPIWRESEQALKLTLAALEQLPDFELMISLHPSEKQLEVARYQNAVAASGCKDRVHFTSAGSSPDLVARASAVISVCSNVAYQAALAGVPTIVVRLGQADALRFDLSGIALGADEPDEMASYLRDIVDRTGAYQTWAHGREQFLQRHGWDFEQDTIDKIVNWVLETAETDRKQEQSQRDSSN